eukprot:5195760-Prymnesium_polylepis.1
MRICAICGDCGGILLPFMGGLDVTILNGVDVGGRVGEGGADMLARRLQTNLRTAQAAENEP